MWIDEKQALKQAETVYYTIDLALERKQQGELDETIKYYTLQAIMDIIADHKWHFFERKFYSRLKDK